MTIPRTLALAAAVLVVAGCAAESRRALPVEPLALPPPREGAVRHRVAIGKVGNESPYLRGIFSDGVDRLGGQARTILRTHLSQSGRFELLDRDNLEELGVESKLAGAPPDLQGAELLVTGAVTEFGRRETGGHALGGLLGRSRSQNAYAKVSISVVEVRTSRVLRSFQGAGECELSNGEVLGFGSRAGYDSTLNDKVLDLAMREAVRNLMASLDAGEIRR